MKLGGGYFEVILALEAVFGALGGLLGSFGNILKAMKRDLSTLGSFWGHLGDLLGVAGGVSWGLGAPLGCYWGSLGCILACMSNKTVSTGEQNGRKEGLETEMVHLMKTSIKRMNFNGFSMVSEVLRH